MSGSDYKNIVEILYHNAKVHGDKTAIITSKNTITYSALAHRVKAIAQFLHQKGVRPGDRVLVFVPMSIELYEILLGLFHIGAIAVFLDAWSDKKRFEQAVETADCTAFIGVWKSHLLRLRSKQLRRVKLNMTTRSFKNLPAGNVPIYSSETDNTALLTFTTGSTSIPKAANRTHGFLLAQHDVLKKHLAPNPDDIDMTTLPIFVLNNLACGTTSIIPDADPRKPEAVDPAAILKQINDNNATTSTASPVFYDKLADHCLANDLKPKTLKKIFLGGAPVFPDLAKKLIKAFGNTDIEIVYGSTEAEPISSIKAEKLTQTPYETLIKGLPVGKPVDDINIKIIKWNDAPLQCQDIEDVSLDAPKIGEICVTGDHVLKDYYNSPEALKANKIFTSDEVWHRTGDGGFIDADGTLNLVGRMSKRFCCNDRWYYLFPLENALLAIPEIQIATIVENDGRAVAAVELKSDKHVSKEVIFEQVIKLGLPCDEVRLMKIPRDPRHNSKIDYHKLLVIIAV